MSRKSFKQVCVLLVLGIVCFGWTAVASAEAISSRERDFGAGKCTKQPASGRAVAQGPASTMDEERYCVANFVSRPRLRVRFRIHMNNAPAITRYTTLSSIALSR